MPDIILFVGAPTRLSTDLLLLQKMLPEVKVLAPAARKGFIGINEASIDKCIVAAAEALSTDRYSLTRFCTWTYEPQTRFELDLIWDNFGKASWIEFLPHSLRDRVTDTRLFISRRQKEIAQALHEVSHSVYARRKTSPLSIPLRNFSSPLSEELRNFWYRGLDQEHLQRELKRKSDIFRQRHMQTNGSFSDNRSLIFAPAADGACHGLPHPTGSRKSFLEGRFRFGAALFPGFHYDVRKAKGVIDCRLYDAGDQNRDLRSEKRTYVNVFPNDHILPKA